MYLGLIFLFTSWPIVFFSTTIMFYHFLFGGLLFCFDFGTKLGILVALHSTINHGGAPGMKHLNSMRY